MKQRLKKQSGLPFTQVPNELLNDIRISLKAKGVYAFMFSKPDNWNFTIGSMSKQLKEGRDGVATAINELKEFDWLDYSKLPDGRGEYIIHITTKINEPNTDIPNMGNNHNRETPLRDIPIVGKAVPFSNTDYNNNKDLSNNTDIKLHSKNETFSANVNNCFLYILNLFPFHLHPKNIKEICAWKDTIEKLHRIDSIDLKLVYELTKQAREDEFWSKQFLSILKLRKKNKDGIPYIVVFNELFNIKENEQRISRQTKTTITSNTQNW